MTPDYYYGETLRWSFGFENPNKAAVIFACLAPLLWAGGLRAWGMNSKASRLSVILFSAIGFLGIWTCLLLTFSRGGVVGAVAGMCLVSGWAWWCERRERPCGRAEYLRRRQFWFASLLLGAVVVGAVSLGMGQRSVEAMWGDDSVGNRIDLWKAALQMAYENPSGFGPGRSGEEYMQWYQEVNRSEVYRTLVNSYLTFLVEYGWWAFGLAGIGVGFFWVWSWPENRKAKNSWSVALWGSLVAFMISGVFSTTMEETLVWVLPISAMAAVVGLRLAAGRVLGFSRWRLFVMMILLGSAMAAIYLFGKVQTLNDPVLRIIAKNAEGWGGVVGVFAKDLNKKAGLWVYPDEEVLGPDWGKLLRGIVMRSGMAVLLEGMSPEEGASFDLMLVGKSVEAEAIPKGAARIILLNPAIREIEVADNTLILLSEIDEDGRGEYWRKQSEASGEDKPVVKVLPGVGTRVEWAWEEVISLISSR